MAEQATAQETTEAGKATTEEVKVLTADQLHDQALQATEAYEKETDEAKKAELFKTAKESVSKAKESYKAEKEAAKKAAEEMAAKGKPPEKYELKLPENSPLSAAHIDKVSSYAKEKGLSNEQAQALLERESNVVAEFKQQNVEQMNNAVIEWQKTVEKDKEIGGEGFKQNAELAKRVVSRFGSDDLKKGLNETGFGNHPELVRMLVRIGKAMTDDQLVVPGTQEAKPAKKTAAERLYGETTPSA